jgi:hypothetical protein
MRCPARFIAPSALAAASLVPLSAASRAAGAQPSLPSALGSFLTEEAHATSFEREALLAGNPLVKLLDADPGKEIAVLGARDGRWRRSDGRHGRRLDYRPVQTTTNRPVLIVASS